MALYRFEGEKVDNSISLKWDNYWILFQVLEVVRCPHLRMIKVNIIVMGKVYYGGGEVCQKSNKNHIKQETQT